MIDMLKTMKVQYIVSVNGYESPVYDCEVPEFELTHHEDGTVTGKASEIDAVEETLCDVARNFVFVKWKLPEENDIWYREAEFPEWSYIKELCDKIEKLEEEIKELKSNHP